MLYTPDERDKVLVEDDIPFPVPGAPMPCILATEERLLLSYYSELRAAGASPGKPVVVNEGFAGTVVIVDFWLPVSFFSIPLSNEILHAHPLAYRGVVSYRVFRIEDSSWIRDLTSAQYAHPRPFPAAFEKSKHYIFTFHDSAFEAVADGVSVRTFPGSIRDAQSEMLELIRVNCR